MNNAKSNETEFAFGHQIDWNSNSKHLKNIQLLLITRKLRRWRNLTGHCVSLVTAEKACNDMLRFLMLGALEYT